MMQDTRVIRQGLQTLLGLAMIVLPVAMATPFDWRALVSATLGGIMTLLTNPRLVPGLKVVMPDAGSSIAVPPSARDGSKGHATPTILLVLVLAFAVLAVSAVLLISLPADAAETAVMPSQSTPVAATATPAHWEGLSYVISATWTCSPVAALTGYQLNVKTTIFQQGVSLGAGAGCRYTGWSVPLSIEAVGGFAANSNAPNAGQGNLIFVVADNFGVGPGMQVFKDPTIGSYTEQMLVSFFLTGSWASTIHQLKQEKSKSAMDGAGFRLKSEAPSLESISQ